MILIKNTLHMLIEDFNTFLTSNHHILSNKIAIFTFIVLEVHKQSFSWTEIDATDKIMPYSRLASRLNICALIGPLLGPTKLLCYTPARGAGIADFRPAIKLSVIKMEESGNGILWDTETPQILKYFAISSASALQEMPTKLIKLGLGLK